MVRFKRKKDFLIYNQRKWFAILIFPASLPEEITEKKFTFLQIPSTGYSAGN